MLRIIAGEYGGRKIEAPKGNDTRPTSDRVREALFSILYDRVKNAVALDLFAGSGALGFEALSRGARTVTFVEHGNAAFRTLRSNAELLGCLGRASFLNCDYMTALQRLAGTCFDIIFLDPPFARISEILPDMLVGVEGVTKPGSLAILEHAEGAVESPVGWELTDERRYGGIWLSFLKRREAGA